MNDPRDTIDIIICLIITTGILPTHDLVPLGLEEVYDSLPCCYRCIDIKVVWAPAIELSILQYKPDHERAWEDGLRVA